MRPYLHWLRQSLILLCLIGLGSCGDSQRFYRYLAVIDSGSSGSRLYLFEREIVESELQVADLTDFSTKKPLSDFASAPADAGPQGVQPLIDGLRQYLDDRGIEPSAVQVNLLATAGMRLVSNEAALAIYDSVRRTLQASGMSVGRIETLSGLLEGAYAWANANYLSGSFGQGGQPLRGIVEVGGASAQIAYESAAAPDEQVARFVVNGRSYRVASESWLGLGQNEARGAMIDKLGSGPAQPCYPNNASAAGGLTRFDTATSRNSVDAATSEFKLDDCLALYDQVIGTFKLPKATSVPELAALDLIGISSVYFALNDWQTLTVPERLGAIVSEQCSGPDAWPRVSAFLGGLVDALTQNACANGTYMQALLFGDEGFKLDPRRLSPQSKIASRSLTWTRGFALVAQ
jgi:hypothetical protein